MKDSILILDFGSQYTHLIKAQLFDLGFNAVIEPADFSYTQFSDKYGKNGLKGIILSGGAHSVYENKIKFDLGWLKVGRPVLGLCYGHQLLAALAGGEVVQGSPEYGKQVIKVIDNTSILKGVASGSTVWMSHRDTVMTLPKGFTTLATTRSSKNIAIADVRKNLYGLQFHPEVSHTNDGKKMLSNFAEDICKMTKNKKWTPKLFMLETAEKYKKIVKNEKIVFGLSGGVDSLTMGRLLRKIFPKRQLFAIYIDSGLMPDVTCSQVKKFCVSYDINLVVHDASVQFFSALKGVTDPTTKGKIIGKVFIEEFEKIARAKKAKFFAQGTIWSDVIESGVTKFSSQIKPHHNVGGLPDHLNFILIEPLRELFKDKVRLLAQYLKLPKEVVQMKVFPGPGYAIRVEGEVNRQKVQLVRSCTKIIEDVVSSSKINSQIWMAFAILIDAPSLGVKGDQRVENEHAIVVRIVESTNSMTVNYSRIAYPLLEEISGRIVRETEIGRVVYDITDKPPATIEWQ